MSASIEIAPVLASLDRAHGDLTDTVFNSDYALQSRVGANTSDFGGGKTGLVRAFAERTIAHVVGVGAEPQVLDIDANGSVASVQDFQAFGNWTFVCRPTRARCKNRFPLSTAYTYSTTSARIDITRVIYAAIRAGFAARRKSCFQRRAARSSFDPSHGDVTASLKVRARIGAINTTSPEIYAFEGIMPRHEAGRCVH